MAVECRVFGDNSAMEFRRISQTEPQNLAKFAAEKRGPWLLCCVKRRGTCFHFWLRCPAVEAKK